MKTFTRSIRHGLVKRLAPKLYYEYGLYRASKDIGRVPRPMIVYLKALMGNRSLRGVEIGTSEALNAVSILKTLKIEHLYLVDPYLDYVEGTRLNPVGMRKQIADEALKPYRDRITRLFLSANEAADKIPNELDFAYIDGNHDFSYVDDDITRYYPKVRVGGLIGGHDFDECDGVVRAVCKLITDSHETLIHHNPDWWVVKRGRF